MGRSNPLTPLSLRSAVSVERPRERHKTIAPSRILSRNHESAVDEFEPGVSVKVLYCSSSIKQSGGREIWMDPSFLISLTKWDVDQLMSQMRSPEVEAFLSLYVTFKSQKFELEGRIEDLEEAIDKQRLWMRRTAPANKPLFSAQLVTLSLMLNDRYRRTEQIQDLEEMVQKVEHALRLTPSNDDDFLGRLSLFGTVLLYRYEWNGRIEDLDRAIEVNRRGVRLTPVGNPDLPSRLNNLALVLQTRHEQTGKLPDLDAAIEKAQHALRLTTPKCPQRSGRFTNLGGMFKDRYLATGCMEDLELAVVNAEEAVKVWHADPGDLARSLSCLATTLERRYQQTERLSDLEMAIQQAKDAVSVTPIGHASRALRLHSLANILQTRYERTGHLADVSSAIENARSAVQATPSTHRALAARLNSLGDAYHIRFTRTRQPKDLRLAIWNLEKAVHVTSADHSDRAAILNNLGITYEARFVQTTRIEHLELAVEKTREAIEALPEGHPSLVGKFCNLGRQLSLMPDTRHRADPLPLFLRSWNCRSGMPFVRLSSAFAAINILVIEQNWSQAADLACQAIRLLPTVNRRNLSHNDRQHVLTKFEGVAALACSLIFEAGRGVNESLEALELGRGAILGFLIDDRRDLSQVRAISPDIADEYERLRIEVNSEHTASNERQLGPKPRVDATKDLDDCVARIRKLPGLDRFLLGLTFEEMQQEARDGPIVIVNVTNVRSDAIVIEAARIRVVNLPAFSAEAIRKWDAQRLTSFSRNDYGKKNKAYRRYLSWIWTACVRHVARILTEGESTLIVKGPKPHVWWIGAGQAWAIPFHAAGNHSPGSIDNTLGHFVSSYTPTIKALHFARERLASESHLDSRSKTLPQELCIVTMPRTPGAADLSGASAELCSIKETVGAKFSVVSLAGPSRQQVQEQLRSCHIFHFAGHGMADPVDPSNSCLVLQREDPSNKSIVQDLLSVADISRMHVPQARLAYLSACSTAENSVTQLADEAIHSVSGFQAAGFPHVIGSMWPSVDQICVDIAHGFYEHICKAGRDLTATETVAEALHSSVMTVREQWWMEPLAWAQYVHFGA